MECSTCKQIKQPTKELKYPCYSCDSCRNLICMDCSDLTSSEIKCLPLQKRILKFNCKSCRNNDIVRVLQNTVTDKETIIKNQEEIIKMLQEKLKHSESNMNDKSIGPSYADIVVKKNNDQIIGRVRQNIPEVIIKPKRAQDSKQTRRDIDKSINLVQLKIGVKNVRNTKTGSVIIKCNTKREMEILKNTAVDKLKDGYDVDHTKMRKPRIKIPNFNQDMRIKEIEKCIIEQNDLTEDFKVTYVKRVRTGSKIIFGEGSANNFKKIMQAKKVFIGWERYPAYEDLSVPRCFQCQGFYHKKQNCTKKITCPLCAEEHEETDCPKQKKRCINCVTANGKYKLNHSVDHHSKDPECPTLKYHSQLLQSKTDYHS